MVGQCPLEALVQVRILVAQPSFRVKVPEEQPKPTSLEVVGNGSGNVDGDSGREASRKRTKRRRARRRQGSSPKAPQPQDGAKAQGRQAGRGAQADPQPERGQALQALQRHGQPAAGRGDWPPHRRSGGRGQDSALCRWRSVLPTPGERARSGCVCGAAHLLSGGPAPGGAFGDD